MYLNKVDDPRSPLDKLHRRELYLLAQQQKVHGVKPEMPAIVMRQLLRASGVTSVPVPRDRVLGQYQGPVTGSVAQTEVAEEKGREVDAEAELAAQWLTPPKMTIQAARKACKEKGIKISPRDKLVDLRAKLGENAT